MDDLCDLALDKLGDLTREVRVDVYSHFDVLTEISWKRALDTIDLRVGLCSHVESGRLRHLGVVIGKVHVAFQTKLRELRPSPLVTMYMVVDGRTEDSEFPNLLLPSGREPYGL